MLTDQEHARQIDPDDSHPGLLGAFVDRAIPPTAPADADGVEDAVEPAPGSRHPCDSLLDLGGPCHVRDDRQYLASCARYALNRFVQAALVLVQCYHARAFSRAAQGRRAANTAGRAGD